jgi:hypothetical protein
LDEFYALFIGRENCWLSCHGYFPKSFESATTQLEQSCDDVPPIDSEYAVSQHAPRAG